MVWTVCEGTVRQIIRMLDGTFLSGHCRLQNGALLLLQGQQIAWEGEEEITGTAWGACDS